MYANICEVHKAVKTGFEETPNFNIYATEEISETGSVPDHQRRFITEAESIYKALAGSLPGGTLDHLLAIMLKEKASHFIVRSWEVPHG